jgi:hypothetical protein
MTTTEARTKPGGRVRPGAGRSRRKKAPPQPEDDSFFASEKWAATFESLVKQYGSGVVNELYGPNGKIRKFCESHRSEAIANQRKLPPYFRQLFMPVHFGWWPSDFLKVAGLVAWDYKPFWESVRLLHVTAQLPRSGSQSPVQLPGLTGKSRLKIADDARPWVEFKQLPDNLQGALLGWLMFPLFGDAGNDDDAVHNVAMQAREELRRFLKVESSLLREQSHAKLRYLRTLRLFEWLREEGKSWREAEEQLATQQGRTTSQIRGDIERARRDLGLSKERPRATPPRNSRKPGRDED